jgi:asparagine synthase (glutamine-hydrolysing)
MCGIYGEVSLVSGRNPDRQAVVRSGSALVHRGPDDDDLHITDRVALGLRRLSIIDVSGGRQPLFNEDRTIAVVCNGEIYNFPELRARLISAGHTFRTGSDAEVLVHLYEEHGDDFVGQLRGMFGFALWDGPRRRLLLGRDRLGIKPVYYANTGQSVAFASETKALLARGDLSARLEPLALENYLALGYVPNPHSLFAGIRKLPPGHIAVIENGTVDERRYWQLVMAPLAGRSEEDWGAEIRAALQASVEGQMISDVPLGAFLSGGIDSTMIVHYMAQAARGPVRTYSIGYDESSGGAFYNELGYARDIATRYGTDHKELVVRPEIVALLPGLIWHLDEPTADSALVTTSLVSQHAAREVKVILSGVGGDELWGGYDRYMLAHYVSLIRRVPAWLRHAALKPLTRALPVDRHSRLLNLFRYLRTLTTLADVGESERYHQLMQVFGRRQLDEMLVRGHSSSDDALLRLLDRYPTEHQLDRIFLADTGTQLTDDLLLLSDKMSMAHSLEARVPLLDERLVDLAATVPASLRVRGRHTRYLLKRALRGVIPDVTLDRRKRGFGPPMGGWLKRELEPVVGKLLAREAVERRGLLRPAAVTRLVDEHRSNRADHTDQLFGLITLELWCRLFLDGQSPADLSAWLVEPV